MMNNNILEYKGYLAKIEFNSEDTILFGKIEGIVDLITFESDNATKIEEEFHKAVDDYLIFCDEVGKEPDKTYKGTFNIRISPQLHKELALKAFRSDESLNQTVENAITQYLKPSANLVSELYTVFSQWTDISDIVYDKSLSMWDNVIDNKAKTNKCILPVIAHIQNKSEKEDDYFVRLR